ncbi:hypothetical protein [Cellulomonas sp. S1-8]|uniref:hypothetical protein n=1 Tax=Cellulomonas sp. S1-8 TaxID=2904790 RepID=UPI0022432601|nr:hypothetical protein [Cellulomonas sp. S1-8]UZN03505.1 hypothetical protein OKX07_00740 [Cellulomonas sp. S1-8]
MIWALLFLALVAPAAIFCAVWAMFPSPDEPPRWRVALAERLDVVADHLRRRHAEPYDPFLTLRVQERLGAVATHVQRLEGDDRTFARAERIIASQLAYDQLLAEACRMAGVEVLPAAKGDPQERFREEVALTERGWTW